MVAATSTVIAGIGLATAAAGTFVSVKGAQAVSAASKRAENLRKKQAFFERMRMRRKELREMFIAQANIRNQGATSGAGQSSSAVIGGAQAAGTNAAYNVGQIDTSGVIGDQIFDANADLASARSTQSAGAGITSLGNQLFTNSQAGGRAVNSLFLGQ